MCFSGMLTILVLSFVFFNLKNQLIEGENYITYVRKYSVLIFFLNQMNQSNKKRKGSILIGIVGNMSLTCSGCADCRGDQRLDAVTGQGIQRRVKSLVPEVLQVVQEISPSATQQETHAEHSQVFEHLRTRIFFQISNWIFRVSVYCSVQLILHYHKEKSILYGWTKNPLDSSNTLSLLFIWC